MEAAAQRVVAAQRRAEDEEPEQRLDRAREDVQVVVTKLAQLRPAHRDRAVPEASGPIGELKPDGWRAFCSRGHP